MLKNFSLILGCAVTVLLAICLVQSFQIADQKEQIRVLHAESSTNATQIKNLLVTVKRLEALKSSYSKELRNLSEQNSDLAAKTKQLVAAKRIKNDSTDPAESKDENNGFGSMIANMLKDPEMRKAMEAQQRQMLKTMYGALYKDLKMTPEQTEQFNDIMLAQQMKAVESAGDWKPLDNEQSDTVKKIKASQEETNQKLKELLGDDGFKTYNDYSTTLPDRMALDQFKNQFSDASLSDQQQQQLLAIMTEERKNSGLKDMSKPENLAQLTSDDTLNKFMEQQQAINDHVLARAGDVLTPQQLQSFGTFQTNMLAMQQVGMKMAQKMWGSKTNSAP